MDSKKYRLLTPIANANDTYNRRLVSQPEATYEHIWRLIHIHESLIVTLGSCFACRLLETFSSDKNRTADLEKLKQMVTGVGGESAQGQQFEDDAVRGCFRGSIGAWFDLLNAFGKRTDIDCKFVTSVREYLTEKNDEPLQFLEPWKRVAEVPSTFLGSLDRIGRINAVITLRNKLAHVPLPANLLLDLHKGLRTEVYGFLTPDTKAISASPFKKVTTFNWHRILRGVVRSDRVYVLGSSDYDEAEEFIGDDAVMIDIAVNDDLFKLYVTPFIRVDKDLKVHILSSVSEFDPDSSDDLIGEYHRFAAEVMPVQRFTIKASSLDPWRAVRLISPAEVVVETAGPTVLIGDDKAPVPIEAEYSPLQLRSKAEWSFRTKEYALAVEYFSKLEASGDTVYYNHVAMSKQGAAMWRWAEMNEQRDVAERIKYIQKAIQLLTEAANHVDIVYQARALYERSKAQWHLWKYSREQKLLEQAIGDAKAAALMVFDTNYISWAERLQNITALTLPQSEAR